MNKECVRRELTMEVIVGAFIAMILFGLVYFTVILSAQRIFTEKFPLEVVFSDVMGLRDGDSVVVRGMPVGKVHRLELQPDGVHVFALLDQAVQVRQGYRMSIVSTSVLGGRYLQVDAGPDGSTPLPGETLFEGDHAYDLMSDAAEVVNELKMEFEEGGIVDNLRKTSSQLQIVVSRIEEGEGTLGLLLNDDQLHKDLTAGVASLRQVASGLEKGEGTLGKLLVDDTLHQDLSETMASLKTLSGRLERGEGTIGKLLNDDQLHEDLTAAVASLRAVADRLDKGEGTLGRLLSSEDQLYSDLAAAVSALKNIAERIESGEGMIGKLVTDDSMYDQLQALIGEVQATVDDFREATPVTTFTSIFFGAF